jgi:hypothetical protein
MPEMSLPAVGMRLKADDAAQARVERPARALIGWMDRGEALLFMTSRRADLAATPEQQALVDAARTAVVSRAAGLDQEGLIEEAPREFADHIEKLRTYPPAEELFEEGWRVVVVDISRVRAAQPIVHVDHAEERTESAGATDVASIAAITIPIQTPAELPGGFDAAQKAWVLTSANPNLRITGAWSGQVNGQAGLGFHVGLLPSFVRVASFQGQLVLVDGYHRAFGLLRRGITRFPALVGDVTTVEALGLPQMGMLPQNAYLGDRPALIRDYLNDEVAADVLVPATQKVVAITALEFQASS